MNYNGEIRKKRSVIRERSVDTDWNCGKLEKNNAF